MTDQAKNRKNWDAPPNSEPWLATDGDPRKNVADLLIRNRDIVRRRVLGKLRRAGCMEIDADDIFSSVARRIDLAMLRHVLRTDNEREFWAYVVVVTDNVTLNRLRAFHTGRATRRSGWESVEDAGLFVESLGTENDNDDAAACLHRVLMAARDDADRELILWKLHGSSYATISAVTGRSEDALRAHWARLCRHIRLTLSDESLPAPPPPNFRRDHASGARTEQPMATALTPPPPPDR